MRKTVHFLGLLAFILMFGYVPSANSALPASPHVNPCAKSPRAEVLCAFENYAKTVQYVVITLNTGLGQSVVKYAFPEDSASVRTTELSRPGNVLESIFIGNKAWTLIDGYDPSLVHWSKKTPIGNITMEARHSMFAKVLALKHSTSPFIDKGSIVFQNHRLRRFSFFDHGRPILVDIDLAKNLPVRYITSGGVYIYSDFNKKIVIKAPSTFGHPAIY